MKFCRNFTNVFNKWKTIWRFAELFANIYISPEQLQNRVLVKSKVAPLVAGIKPAEAPSCLPCVPAIQAHRIAEQDRPHDLYRSSRRRKRLPGHVVDDQHICHGCRGVLFHLWHGATARGGSVGLVAAGPAIRARRTRRVAG